MLDEGTKEKFKSSLLMELLSKKYPDLKILAKQEEARDFCQSTTPLFNEIKAYFDKAASTSGLKVEYKVPYGNYVIDVVFGGHLIKFVSRGQMFFSNRTKLTLSGRLIKFIIEVDLKRPVILLNDKWFINEDNKYQRLKT